MKHIHLATPHDLLDAIAPRGRFFGPYEPRLWIFRGHSREEYNLIPTALRNEFQERLHDIAASNVAVRSIWDTNIAQTLAETSLLSDMQDEMDSQGLPIPQPAIALGAPLPINTIVGVLKEVVTNNDRSSIMMRWPDPHYLTLMSLAQHYRLPTRLLDWTRSPYSAAYFAAATAADGSANGNASVWALNTFNLTSHQGLMITPETSVRVLTVPRSTNPNLHAQDGVFTMQVPEQNPRSFGPIARQPLDELLGKIPREICTAHDQPRLYHFTFPREVASELLWLLAKEGITAAKMFPGYAGAAQAVKERHLRRRPKNWPTTG